MSQKIELQPAYVLHTREYRDTSLLVDFLTLDHGLIRAVARGVRGGKSHKRALLQPLQPLLVSVSGRSELLTMGALESAAPVFQLHGERLFSVLYLNEVLCRLLQPGQCHPEIYRLYQSTLTSLLNHSIIECSLRRFEYELLLELGYCPDLSMDAGSGEPIYAHHDYFFDPATGLTLCKERTESTQAHRFSGQQLLDIKSLLTGDQPQYQNKQILSATKRFMRQALRPLLGNKPLTSRQLFVSAYSPSVISLPQVGDNG